MAYEKFIKAVESSKLLKEIERNLVFGKHCNREYSGEVSQLGDQIRVDGLGDVTIYNYNKDGTYTVNGTVSKGKDVIQKNMPDPETPEGYTATFTINQLATFNIGIGDIDKELAKDGAGLVGKYRAKAGKKIARLQDEYIARSILGFKDAQFKGEPDNARTGNVYYLTKDTDSTSDTSETIAIMNFIDSVVLAFDEVDLENAKLVCECTPKFYRLLRRALNAQLTDNNSQIEERNITKVDGIDFVMTNNKEMKGNGFEYVIFRTMEAVSFWNPLQKAKAYDLGKDGFGDGYMAFSYYDVGITSPKQMLWAKVAY